MTKICCFVQRQDGHVLGLVSKGSDGDKDLSTARTIVGDSEDGEDEMEAALRILKEETNLGSDYALRVAGCNGTEIYDMEVTNITRAKLKDPDNEILMWIHPWHLSQGPTGDLASAGFAFNDTRVVEPVKYEGRKNKDFVGLPAGAIPPGALPGALGALAASGTQVIGVPPGGSMSIGVGANGQMSVNGGVSMGGSFATKKLTPQELQTLKPWDDETTGIDGNDEDALWKNVKGADFIFAIPDQQYIDEHPAEDWMDTLVLTPASYFYSENAWWDGHVESTMFDNICVAEMESIFSPTNNLTLAQVKSQLLAMGCVEEPKLLQI